MRFVSGDCRMIDLSTHSPDLHKSLYRGLKRVWSCVLSNHVYYPDGHNTISLSQGLTWAVSVSWEGEPNAIPRTGEETGSL